MAEYYDYLLGLIPLAFASLTGLLVLFGIGLTTAVPLAALAALGLVSHGMFINGPADVPTPQSPPERTQPFTSAD
jgi:hypothetical protein